MKRLAATLALIVSFVLFVVVRSVSPDVARQIVLAIGTFTLAGAVAGSFVWLAYEVKR
jgi:hypothetical protein